MKIRTFEFSKPLILGIFAVEIQPTAEIKNLDE